MRPTCTQEAISRKIHARLQALAGDAPAQPLPPYPIGVLQYPAGTRAPGQPNWRLADDWARSSHPHAALVLQAAADVAAEWDLQAPWLGAGGMWRPS
jgi:hypothetical protein